MSEEKKQEPEQDQISEKIDEAQLAIEYMNKDKEKLKINKNDFNKITFIEYEDLFKKIKPELDIFNPGEHNGTFRGFQMSMITAKAALEFMLKNNIEKEVKRKEKIVKEYLEKEIKPLLKENMTTRGIGLMWGIEFNDGKLSRSALDKCFEKGLIIELAGRNDSVLKIMPALTIEDELLIKGLDIIKESIKEVLWKN